MWRLLEATALVLAKEVQETLRVPHVLLMAGMPLLLYPALIWLGVELALIEQSWHVDEVLTVAVVGPAELEEALEEQGLAVVPDEEGALRSGAVDARVQATEEDGVLAVDVAWDDTRPRSKRARKAVRRAVKPLGEVRLKQRITEAGADPDDLVAFAIDERDLGGSLLGGTVLGVALGVLSLVAMIGAGAYPAVAAIVAEREAGTLETLLTSAAPRVAVLMGKLLAVWVWVMVAVLGNVISCTVTLSHVISLLDRELSVSFLSWPLLACCLPLASTGLMVAALYVLVSMPARTFKEGELAGTMAMVALLGLLFGTIRLASDGGDAAVWLPLTGTLRAMMHAFDGSLTPIEVVAPTVVHLVPTVGMVAAALWLGADERFVFGGWLPRWLAWTRRER